MIHRELVNLSIHLSKTHKNYGSILSFASGPVYWYQAFRKVVCPRRAYGLHRHPSAGGDYPAQLYREEVRRDGGTGGARRGHEGPDAGLQAREAGLKIGIESKGAQTAGKYSVAEHVKGLHVVFMPERTTDSGGNKSKQFLQGCRVEELPLNTVEKEEPEP